MSYFSAHHSARHRNNISVMLSRWCFRSMSRIEHLPVQHSTKKSTPTVQRSAFELTVIRLCARMDGHDVMQLMKEILRQMKECDNDEEIKAIILTGTDGVFSVGADMKELSLVKTYGEVRLICSRISAVFIVESSTQLLLYQAMYCSS